MKAERNDQSVPASVPLPSPAFSLSLSDSSP